MGTEVQTNNFVPITQTEDLLHIINVRQEYLISDVYTDGQVVNSGQQPQVETVLFVRNIFVSILVHNIYVAKQLFKKITQHKMFQKSIPAGTTLQQTIAVSEIKFPVTELFIGI